MTTPNLFLPFGQAETSGTHAFSPLVLADCLLTLAQEADRAGYRDSACRLLGLIDCVLDGERAAQA